MPVILAMREAEAGEPLEPGGRGCSEPRSFTALQPGQQEQNSISKKKKKKIYTHTPLTLLEMMNMFI